MTAATATRIAEWTGTNPLKLDFSFRRASEPWLPGPVKGMEHHDLGMTQSSHGEMSIKHIRLAGKPADVATEWVALDVELHFFLVLRGHAKLENDAGEIISLETGIAAYQPAFLRYRLHDFSPDFEMFEVMSPADPRVIRGKDAPLPKADSPRVGQYLKETPESYVVGGGLRRFFAYRDLGTASRTGGTVHIQAFKVVDTKPNPIGWHVHRNMRQFIWVIAGSAGFLVEGHPEVKTIDAGDAICMPLGLRHAVPSYNAEYRVIEMCIPGAYDTEDVKAPDQ